MAHPGFVNTKVKDKTLPLRERHISTRDFIFMTDSSPKVTEKWQKKDWDTLPKPRHSISEVAELFGVEEYTLRYWEQETKLSPKRFPGSGARWYSKEDLMLIEKIYYLVEVKGLTLKAANKLLDAPTIDRELEILTRLQSVRDKLVAIRERISPKPEKNA